MNKRLLLIILGSTIGFYVGAIAFGELVPSFDPIYSFIGSIVGVVGGAIIGITTYEILKIYRSKQGDVIQAKHSTVQNETPKFVTRKAGFVFRGIALFLDCLILWGAFVATFYVFSILASILSLDDDARITFVLVGGNFGWIVIFLSYFLFFWTYSGQTPGNKVMRIKVIDVYGETISSNQALLRLIIGYNVNIISYGLGFLWAIWDTDRQGWHDKIAKTYVVTE